MLTNDITQEHVPQKMLRLIRSTRELEDIKSAVSNLGEDIVLDIIDGWTTGDNSLDFALVSCVMLEHLT